MKNIVKVYSKKSIAVFMSMCLMLSCMVLGLTTISVGEVNAESNIDKAGTVTKETVNGEEREVFNVATTLYDYYYDNNSFNGVFDGSDNYTNFNTAIQNWYKENGSNYLRYPLYFGNFYNSDPSYDNWNRLANVSNESAGASGINSNAVTQGLLNITDANSMENLPYFNEEFLNTKSQFFDFENGKITEIRYNGCYGDFSNFVTKDTVIINSENRLVEDSVNSVQHIYVTSAGIYTTSDTWDGNVSLTVDCENLPENSKTNKVSLLLQKDGDDTVYEYVSDSSFKYYEQSKYKAHRFTDFNFKEGNAPNLTENTKFKIISICYDTTSFNDFKPSYESGNWIDFYDVDFPNVNIFVNSNSDLYSSNNTSKGLNVYCENIGENSLKPSSVSIVITDTKNNKIYEVESTQYGGWQNGNAHLYNGFNLLDALKNSDLIKNDLSYGSMYSNLILPFSKNSAGYWEFDGSKTPVYYDETINTILYDGIEPTKDASVGTPKEAFFPFNNGDALGTENERISAINYGFGTKIEFDFLVPESKEMNGEHINFNFSGDDDVWVFIDGELVLDMGGAHGKATGKIDFTTGEVIITTGIRTINADGSYNLVFENGTEYKTEVELIKNIDTSKPHKLTMYYMERGMFESNMYISFNMTIDSILEVSSKLNTNNVNDFFKEETLKVAEKDVFAYEILNDGSANVGTSLLYPTYDKKIVRNNNGIKTIMSVIRNAEYFLYLDVTEVMNSDEPKEKRFSAYFWYDSGGSGKETWCDVIQYDNNIYRVKVPTKENGEPYDNVIFCLMKEKTSENIWNNMEKQTNDLKVYIQNLINNDNNLYIISSFDRKYLGYWDNSNYPSYIGPVQELGNFVGSNDGKPIPVSNTNYIWNDKIVNNSVVGRTDNDGIFKLLYNQNATFQGEFVKNSEITVTQINKLYTQGKYSEDEVTSLNSRRDRTLSDYYTTSVSLKDYENNVINFNLDTNNGYKTIYSFSNNSVGSTRLYEIFENTVKTNSLTISKKTDIDQENIILNNENLKNQEYRFKIYFYDIFGAGVTYTSDEPLLYTGTVTKDGKDIQVGNDGIISIKRNESFTIKNIPVGTKYKIVEQDAYRDKGETGYIVKDIKVDNDNDRTFNLLSKTTSGTIPTTDNTNVSVEYTNTLVRDVKIYKEVWKNYTPIVKDPGDITNFEFTIKSDYTNLKFERNEKEVIIKNDSMTDGFVGTTTFNQAFPLIVKDVPIQYYVQATENNMSKENLINNSNYDSFLGIVTPAKSDKINFELSNPINVIEELNNGETKLNSTFTDNSIVDVEYSFKNHYKYTSPPTLTINKYVDELYYGENYDAPDYYNDYKDAEQCFVFKVEMIETYDVNAPAYAETYVVLKFPYNSDKLAEVITNGDKTYNYYQTSNKITLPRGIYRITEMSSIAWRYQCDGLTVKAIPNQYDNAPEYAIPQGDAVGQCAIFDLSMGGEAIATFYNSNINSDIQSDMSSKTNEISTK